MNYRQLSDTELINLFLETSASHSPQLPLTPTGAGSSPIPRGEREAVRDEMFGRYYERFDQRIRAVLYTCGLPYSPAEFYYNEIFTDIYRQVFDLSEFGEILEKYRPEKGEFANWFMNYVVVNRVRDWLKKVDKVTGLKNIERLKENTGQEERYLSLDESVNRGNEGLTLAEIIPAGSGPSGEAETPDIAQAIQQLPPSLRLILRLLFLVYEDLPDTELTCLAGEIHSPVAVIKDRLEQICRELEESPKYEEGERIELALACLARQEEHWQRQVKRLESEIEALFSGWEIPAVGSHSQFKDITQARQELEQAYRQKQISHKEYNWQSLCLQHQHLAKQLAKSARKRAKLIEEYRSGKYFIFPSYRQLARLLNISESAVSSRINRTVNRLKDLLPARETGANFRNNESGDMRCSRRL